MNLVKRRRPCGSTQLLVKRGEAAWVNSPDEGALRGHAQALVVQVGDTEASGMEMTFACGTKQSRES